ncbi:collectrin [Dendropsophus ebraccatus]|uniref:collectrin n=1 Tax=Dendropsophus ebraccatus TaxID=150705 RepID=UPI0038311F86
MPRGKFNFTEHEYGWSSNHVDLGNCDHLQLKSIAVSELCGPDAPGAFKVRFNIKKALGDKAYPWNDDEEFLFKAVMVFAMRAHVDNTIQLSNILICNVTPRVSFWFVVTSPSNSSEPVQSTQVKNAIRHERNRINSAFLLDDRTLEFLAIPPTMAPEAASSSKSWMIVFGVVVGLLGVATILLVVSGIRNKRRRNNAKTEDQEDCEDRTKSTETAENGAPLYSLNFSEGADNETFDNLTYF